MLRNLIYGAAIVSTIIVLDSQFGGDRVWTLLIRALETAGFLDPATTEGVTP
jgi:hypothetical protein